MAEKSQERKEDLYFAFLTFLFFARIFFLARLDFFLPPLSAPDGLLFDGKGTLDSHIVFITFICLVNLFYRS